MWGLPCICGSLLHTACLYILVSIESYLWHTFYRYITIEISSVPQNNTNMWETAPRYYSFILVLFFHKLAAQSLPLLLMWSDRVRRAVHKPLRYSQICLTSILERMCYTQHHALAPVSHKMKANLKAANIFMYNYLPSHCTVVLLSCIFFICSK